MCFKALLLHGSLPEDEQDGALCLDQGEADQQVVMLSFLFLHLGSVFSVRVVYTLSQRLSVFSTDQVSSSWLGFVKVCVPTQRG